MKAFNYLWGFFSLILVIQEVVVLLLQNLLFRLILTFFFGMALYADKYSKSDLTSYPL